MADKNLTDLLLGIIEYNVRALATAADEDIPKRPQFCEGARLRFQVPIDPDQEIHSWIGGNPRLPDPFIWPIQDGHPLHFLTQIDCSQLPENIWRGAGPHTGWLAFFVSFEHAAKTRVIHTATLGPGRMPPMPWLRKDLQLYPFNYAPAGWEFEPPK